MNFRVIFTYDPSSRKWIPSVEGAESKLDAVQGFNAVAITCREIDPDLMIRQLHNGLPIVSDDYVITPVVR